MSDHSSNFRNQPRRRWRFFFIPLTVIGVVLLVGAVVQWLWNAILPPVLGVGLLNYWQAVGLLVLCRILFGGFRGGSAPWRKGRWGGAPPHIRERWMQMSDEERARFRQSWRERCRKRDDE